MNQPLREQMLFIREELAIGELVEKVQNAFTEGYLQFYGIRAVEIDHSSQSQFELSYDFFNPELFKMKSFVIRTNDNLVVPSLKEYWPLAMNDERRIFELFGVRFGPHYWDRHFVDDNIFSPDRIKNRDQLKRDPITYWPYDKTVLTKELESRTRECRYFKMGEWVDELDLHLRIREGKVLDIALKPSLNLVSPLPNKWSELAHFLANLHPHYGEFWVQSWFRLQEKANGVEPTERCMAVRMVILELSRIFGHLQVVREMYKHSNQKRTQKKLDFWFIELTKLKKSLIGDKSNFYPYLFGGLKDDIRSDWLSLAIEMLESFRQTLNELRSFLDSDKDFKQGLAFAEVQGAKSIQHGLGGSNLRASGINWDERMRSPFYFYDQIDMEISIGTNGSNLDRLIIKIDELILSSSIIIQLLDNIPEGEVQHPDWPLERIAFDGLPEMPAFFSTYVEAPHGLMGFHYTRIDGWRFSTPTFRSHGLMASLVKNFDENQAKLTLASFGWSSGEMFI